MSKILIIAEKPSVARDIGKNLHCNLKGDGYLYNDQYIVSWAIGHLVALANPDEIDPKYKRWIMEDLPILPGEIPLKVLPKTKKQFNLLKKMMNSADVSTIICATDAGREGELIFRLIYTMAKSQKPIQRLWISSMTDEAIMEGFSSLRPSSQYDSLYQSALSRAQADWLVGMNASRAFTLAHGTLLSIGRVQTPTLGILVKRQREIDAFVPEEYFVITGFFEDYQGVFINNPKDKNSKISTNDQALEIAAKVKGKIGTIISNQIQEKRELPPQLYDLTSLQRDANRLLGFSAQKTLKAAQSLYETKKAITYPRTDSRYISKDLIPQVYKTMELLPQPYYDQGQKAMNQGKLPFSKRIVDDQKVTDHHAMMPTAKKISLSSFSPDEEKIFNLIAKRFVAAFYPAYVYNSQEVITKVEDILFLSRGTTVVDLGWKELYPPKAKKTASTKDAADESGTLPLLAQGDQNKLLKTTIKQEATKPPPLHTEASLLSAMENAGKEMDDEELKEQLKGSGLGTPATRAAIIERLLTVEYILRKGKALVPTQKGMSLISVVPEALSSPLITGQWELGLNKIVTKEENQQDFMQGIYAYSASLVEAAKKSTQTDVVFEKGNPVSKKKYAGKGSKNYPDLLCPVCKKGHVTENQKAFGCSQWKAGCKFTLWKNALVKSGGPLLSEKIITLLLTTPQAAGSTGTLFIGDGKLSFQKKGSSSPYTVPLEYTKGRTGP